MDWIDFQVGKFHLVWSR